MIASLDHLVLTTDDSAACIDFYTRVLGMELQTFGAGRLALKFGRQKINIHERNSGFHPKAHSPVPGALDLCFLSDRPIEDVLHRLAQEGCPVIEGPVDRTGATGPLRSVYVRDPDNNLIEISQALQGN